MIAFRVLLASIVGMVLVYTGLVGATQGWNFMPVFFEDIIAMTWPGQFNLDFSCLLILSGLWLACATSFRPQASRLVCSPWWEARRCCARTC